MANTENALPVFALLFFWLLQTGILFVFFTFFFFCHLFSTAVWLAAGFWLQLFFHNNSQVFFQRTVLDDYLIQHIQYFLHQFLACRQITWCELILNYIYHLLAWIVSNDPKTREFSSTAPCTLSSSNASIIFHSKGLFLGHLCQLVYTC